MVNHFPDGDKLMNKLHFMVKHFSSTSSNRKNYNETKGIGSRGDDDAIKGR